MTDILITCPPMLKSMDKFRGKLKDLGFRANCPNVVQTLSERELIDLVPKYEGWIIGDDPATMKVLEAGINGRLRALVKWGIGVDNIDLEATKNLGLKFSNTPMMFGAEVADLALSYIISLSRETYQIHCEVKAGKWIKPRGISLKGRTLGIVGLGDIGRNLAKRSQACELNIIGYDPYVSQSALDPKIKKKEWPDHIEQIDFLYGDAYEQGDNGTKHLKPARSIEKYKKAMITHHQAMLYRRATLSGIAYDTHYKIAGDYKFTCEFIQRSKVIHYTQSPICCFEVGGISQRKTSLARKEQYMIRREMGLTSFSKSVMIYYMQVCALVLRRICPSFYWFLRENKRAK